jgi:hypothetical protein
MLEVRLTQWDYKMIDYSEEEPTVQCPLLVRHSALINEMGRVLWWAGETGIPLGN